MNTQLERNLYSGHPCKIPCDFLRRTRIAPKKAADKWKEAPAISKLRWIRTTFSEEVRYRTTRCWKQALHPPYHSYCTKPPGTLGLFAICYAPPSVHYSLKRHLILVKCLSLALATRSSPRTICYWHLLALLFVNRYPTTH